MRSALVMVGGWLVVTGLTVGVAVGAVGLVSDSMTVDRPRPLSAAAVDRALGAEARTYHLRGGEVRVLFSPDGAIVGSAISTRGFSLAQRTLRGGVVEVEMRSGDHESRLRAWWDGGPKDEVEEN